MAASPTDVQPRGSAEFVESSVLEAVVPADSFLDIEDELESWDGSVEDESSGILPFVPQRQVLLFDELVPVYVVFRTPLIEDATLKSYLNRLVITLEVIAFSTAPPSESEPKGPPPKEVIFTETIKDSNAPTIFRYEEEEASPHIYIVWKVEVFICRPRGRFLKPAVYFRPTASLKPADIVKRDVLDDEYLPSKVPTALNLLQSFENDPALHGTHPRLSALRISRVAPTAPVAKEITRPIRNGQRRLFRALPALVWRMRYSRLPSSLSDMSLIASLDLEVANVTGYKIGIDDIRVSLRGGRVETVADHKGASVVHAPGDQVTYMYKVTPDLAVDGTPLLGSEGHVLTVNINGKALVSEECRPNIAIEWRTGVDFTVEHNPNLMKAAHRLSNPGTQPPRALNPDSFPPRDKQPDDASHRIINVTLTISGPPTVHVGEIFRWIVFIVNRSEKTRKLAVLVIPKRKRDSDRHKSHASTSSAGGVRGDKKLLLAAAVMDENIVYAKQKHARIEVADLICLTTDVRIGHLAPGACYTAELKFLALSSGALTVDAVRIVDLATQEASDVRDLPSMIAIGKEK